MTYEEAIKQVEIRLSNMRMTRCFYKYPPSLMVDTIDFLKTTKEALEKQIPKKPKEEWSESPFSDDNGCLFQHLMCPNCGKMEVNKLDDFRDDFCPHCGQAIDWSDAE